MPFEEKRWVMTSIDCAGASSSDRLRVVLMDDRDLVFQVKIGARDHQEHGPSHRRLYVDREESSASLMTELDAQARHDLAQFQPGAMKRRIRESVIGYYCWADDWEFWTGDRASAKHWRLLAWPTFRGVNDHPGPKQIKIPSPMRYTESYTP